MHGMVSHRVCQLVMDVVSQLVQSWGVAIMMLCWIIRQTWN